MVKRMLFGVVIGLALVTAATSRADAPMRVTKAEAREFVSRWFPAWVGGAASVPRLVAFYAPDAVYRDPNVPKSIQGHEALTRFFTVMLGNNPDWKFEVIEIYPTEKGFILNWKARIPLPDGRVLEDFRGVDVLELDRDGLIAKHEDYFDLSVFRGAAGGS